MDLILVNGNIRTMDGSKPLVQAAAVNDGKIVYTGSDSGALQLRTDRTNIIDLKGKTLVPGFNDSHMHLVGYGAFMEKANLSCTRSIDELIQMMRNFISSGDITPNSWVQGRGWNHDYFDIKRFPTRHDLDRITKDYPICLSRACGHVCVVNSKALNEAGINRNTPQVEGGHFDVDEHGEPLGIFRENALSLIYDRIQYPDVEDIKTMIVKAADNALNQGLTSIQTDDFESVPGKNFRKVITAYEELEKEGRLPVRINQQCLLPDIMKLQDFLETGLRTGQGSEFYKIGPVKLLADGSLGARTAYLSEPYSDDDSTCGIPVYSQKDLDLLVKSSHDAGMQVAVHCIGDGAMYMAFKSIEKALANNPKPGHRHSIVHCQITDDMLLDKFKTFDVLAHIQPIFLDYDLHIAEDRIGIERVKSSYNWKSLLDREVHVAFGSDCPVEPFNVIHGIYCAVTRMDLNGYPDGGWLPDQKLTVPQAVYGFTLGSAYASFEENIKGSITPGKLADMAVLSHDIFTIEPEDIKDVDVLMTIVNGKLVYEKNGALR